MTGEAPPWDDGHMPKFAQPRPSDGLHAYVVTTHSWGKSSDSIVWASNLKEAKYKYGWTRASHSTVTVRRAKTEDVSA